jgi:hypothetical protein
MSRSSNMKRKTKSKTYHYTYHDAPSQLQNCLIGDSGILDRSAGLLSTDCGSHGSRLNQANNMIQTPYLTRDVATERNSDREPWREH